MISVGPCKGGYPCPPQSVFQSLVCRYFGRYPCRCRKFNQKLIVCRHFVALVSRFQGRIASRNLPLSGPYQCNSVQLQEQSTKCGLGKNCVNQPIFLSFGRLKKFITTPRKVMPLDKIYFVCPNPFEYPVKRELTYSKEKLYENIYMVDKAGYDSCNASGPSSMLIIKCNQPFTLQHSTVVFQGMSPTQGDPEFIPGNEYYFIGEIMI